jgi:hypothetical protein
MNDEIDEDHFESYFHGLSDYEPEDDFVDFPDFEEDREDYDEPIEDSVWADADALASAGMGTDEDYGYYGEFEDW